MIQKSDITVTEFAIFLTLLPEEIRNYICELDHDKILESMDFLPEDIARTGRILKFTLYDYLGKDDPNKNDNKDCSGLCEAFLFSLDDGATVEYHEHKDTKKPTDSIEKYIPKTPNITDHSGEPLTDEPCLFGQKHGIGPMPKYSLVDTIKADRNNTIKIGVPSPYPKQKTNKDLDR